MTPSHARKEAIKYRYYISSALVQGQAEQAGSPQPCAGTRDRGDRRKSRSGAFQRADRRKEDAALIRDHVVRVEVKSDRLMIELADAKRFEAKTKTRPRKDRDALAQNTIDPAA